MSRFTYIFFGFLGIFFGIPQCFSDIAQAASWDPRIISLPLFGTSDKINNTPCVTHSNRHGSVDKCNISACLREHGLEIISIHMVRQYKTSK